MPNYHIVAFFYRIAYLLTRLACFLYYDIRIEGRENLSEKTGLILAANHRSYLDPVLVYFACPKPMNYIAKENLFKNPIFGSFIRLMGAFPASDTRNPEYDMIAEASRRLEHRRNLTIFPEGTRHTDGKVGRGKNGVCLLAARSGKPVVPIGLIFNSNNLHFRSKICIRIGKPIYASDYGLTPESSSHDIHTMKKDMMDTIRTMVEENPPFPIKHDKPRKRTTIEIAEEQHRAERMKQQAKAAEQTEEL